MEIWTSSTASRTYGFMSEHVTAYRVSGAAQADPRPDVVTNGDQCRLRLAGRRSRACGARRSPKRDRRL